MTENMFAKCMLKWEKKWLKWPKLSEREVTPHWLRPEAKTVTHKKKQVDFSSLGMEYRSIRAHKETCHMRVG